MTASPSESPDTGESVLTVIRNIQQGTVDPRNLQGEDRQRCVEHLSSEGYSAAEVAEILKVSERTIKRDRARICLDNAIRIEPQLVDEMVGRLVQQAETVVSRIRRLTRETSTPAPSRIDGEKACWAVTNELVQRLQSLGYLPTTARQFQGELIHRLGESPGYEQLQGEVTRLEIIVAEHGADPRDGPVLEELAQVKDEIGRLGLSARVRQLASTLDQGYGDTDEHEPDQ